MIEVINKNYDNIPQNIKEDFRKLIINNVEHNLSTLYRNTYIIKKFCLFVITWIKYDFPTYNPNFFIDLLNLYKNNNTRIQDLKFLIDLLLIFDDEMIKFRHTYTPYEMSCSTRIKDYLRENFIVNLNEEFAKIINKYTTFDSNIICKILEVISQIIDWNQINKFKDILLFIFKNFIQNKLYINQCLEIMNAIVKKGMDIIIKIEMINYFNINNFLNIILNQYINNNTLEESEPLLNIFSDIINNLGFASLNAFGYTVESKKDKTKFLQNMSMNVYQLPQNNVNIINSACDIFFNCFNLVIIIMNKKSYSSSLIFSEFIFHAIYYLKILLNPPVFPLHNSDSKNSQGNISNSQLKNDILIKNNLLPNVINNFFQTLQNNLRIPNEYNLATISDLSALMDDDYFRFRKEYSVIYSNMYLINKYKHTLLDSIISLNNQYLCQESKCSLNDIEHLLFLINIIQNNIPESDIKSVNLNLKLMQLSNLLLNSNFISSNNSINLLLFYETINKYIIFFKDNENILSQLFELYYSDKGMITSNFELGSKIASIYDKTIEKLKVGMNQNLANSCFIKLINLITQIIDSKNNSIISQFEILFHTLGCIIGYLLFMLIDSIFYFVSKLINSSDIRLRDISREK